jgi:predicted  nucleic acid-binding Zn-ribbon protein
MNPQRSYDDLEQRIRVLERQNNHLRHQNDLLNEAIETICAAFLNNSKGLNTAIQAAIGLQARASEAIKRSPRDLEIE